MENEIKKFIVQLFEPTIKIISEQTNCKHNWPDKNGSAYFRCGKCGYVASNLELDRLIQLQKFTEKGATPDMIKRFKDYI